MCGRLFPLVLVCFFLAASAYSQTVVENESAVSIVDGEAVVQLVVDSDTARSVTAKAELIDTFGSIRALRSTQRALLRKGKHAIELRLPLGEAAHRSNDDLAWYRLRYTVGEAAGIIAMLQLMPDLFELRIIAGNDLLTGTTYRARVRAVNRFTGAPAAGVKIETIVELELRGDDDKKLALTGEGTTDAEGFAVIDFTIPAETELDDDGEVKVTGRRNGLVREAHDRLRANPYDVQILAMTDKPIYQPGQMLNLRGIVLKGFEGKTVVPNSEVEFRIEDEDNTLLYREKVMSSVFGIAAMAWRVPANAKLGNYRIEMRDAEGREISVHQVKVSRYDLPNFAVNAKPSKPYYLPEDKVAEIEIRADYLFGKPVTKGKVRVVEETSREWNWKEQKYKIDEGETREGEADAEGKFIAKFDLKEKHEDLDEDDRYDDLKFAAYFTDLTTNKTEQRRFDIRVTREPIHVYLIEGLDMGNSRLPMNAYVSTFYADGTPAECDVEIKASIEDEDKFKTIGRIRTNSFGAGKIAMPRPNIGDSDDNLDFRVLAKDEEGRRGTAEDEVYFDDDDEGIRVYTDRSIYKPGETMKVELVSTVKSGIVYIDVVRGWSVVDSRFATLKDGKAVLRIPYSDQFAGELKIAAFIEDPKDDDDLVQASRGVIFPAKQGISVEASFDKAVYKPNDEATVKFGILDVVGRAVESALGVVVFDKAVEEPARTDADFGGMFRGLGGWLGYGDGFGGVNVKDLNALDLSKPMSDEMQLVAEVILHDNYYHPNIFHSKRYREEARSAFAGVIANQMNPLAVSLQSAYTNQDYLHPVNDASLRNILDARNIDFDAMRDPWGVAYKAEFSVDKAKDVVTIKTAGPDKMFDTNDDFTAYTAGFEYFTPMGKAIGTAVGNHYARTSELVRDQKTLLGELGVREILDRFGRPYHFDFGSNGRNYIVGVRSNGPDGKHEEYYYNGDDFQVWSTQLDYFSADERRITQIQSGVKKAPADEAGFKASLKEKGFDFDRLRDGKGNPLYINVEQKSRFWDKVAYESVQNYGDVNRVSRRIVTPVTQKIVEFTIRGNGNDGKKATYDDITFTQVVHVLSEQSKDDLKPVPVVQPISYGPNSGAIAGVVTDASGAVVPNATLTAINAVTSFVRTTVTNDEGRFLFAQLPAGTYSVRAESPGFVATVVQSVQVVNSSTATVNIVLEIGTVSSTVDVTASAEVVETTSASVGANINTQQIVSLPLNGRNFSQLVQLQPGAVKVVTKSGTGDDLTGTDQQTSTPRLREYFPETLLWQPEVITNADGKAEVKFRMADNITTWKMYTIASTKDGKIGFAEKEATAFQSFFVDLDPPKFLTTGDEIFLPTQVRNYTEKKQNVNVTMAAANWFSLLSNGTKQIGVGSGETENAVFGFKAVTPVKDGKQRVTAMAETDSDAIERPVTVRPDGREVVHTESRYFAGNEKLDLDFPSNTLANTQSAELKIYPNLMAHVAESVEGLLRRPYGCGEQTISSTYPNVMILKFSRGADGNPRRISEPVEKKARKFQQSGYERLLGYQVADGGFSYWGGKDSADFALTAYALRFLADASAFITVDAEAVKRAEDWLIKQQRPDGSWGKKYHWEQLEDTNRSKSTTTYVARTLAMSVPSAVAGGSTRTQINDALAKALTYLRSRNAEIDDPYSLSLLGLAAHDAGNKELAQAVVKKLAALAKDEGGASYWNLESNTAFNGWGTAGRVETTALATRLLMKLKTDQALVGRAMIFLLKNKDRYGVWYSTQTTVNVLDTFVASIAADDQASTQQVQVLLNGQPVKTVEIGPDKLDQIIVELRDLTAGKNTIELRSPTRSPMMAQIVANHYIDWRDADSSGRDVNQSRALRLDYKCDRTEAPIMQEVSCAVEAERIGYRGYGMLLAEIGTPPGADVSRESLQAAMDADWSISRYDILPDRVVLYMWSKAGGTKFNFKFRPRYGINAQTPASTVYDYYNPEAQATVAPIRFQVK